MNAIITGLEAIIEEKRAAGQQWAARLRGATLPERKEYRREIARIQAGITILRAAITALTEGGQK